ncbi:MAG: DotD/TraH family lipoprotein [Desulfovibrio sp.]|jgi:hypothetical protein|nr:DotD/TraH family lipoprotein [Desulfovibrio sp.]
MDRFRNHLLFSLPLLACALLLCGCAKRVQPEKALTAQELVDRRIADAAEAISRDLAVLTGSTQARDASSPAGEGDLYRRISLVWEGPMEGALARVAASIGYTLDVRGKRPASPRLVHAKLLDRPALAVIRELGLATGSDEHLEVDESLRLLRLEYRLEKDAAQKAKFSESSDTGVSL